MSERLYKITVFVEVEGDKKPSGMVCNEHFPLDRAFHEIGRLSSSMSKPGMPHASVVQTVTFEISYVKPEAKAPTIVPTDQKLH
jgi:hypothetical protein